MKYLEIRSSVKSGDIIAYSHRSWKTWYDIKVQMIRIFTRSEYSHVGLAWVYGGRVFIIESVAPLIRIVPLSNTGNFYHISMNVQWSYQTEDYALGLVGTGKYSQLEAINSFLGNPSKISPTKNWQCCKFAIVVLALCGIRLRETATATAVVQSALEMNKTLTYVEV